MLVSYGRLVKNSMIIVIGVLIGLSMWVKLVENV